MGSHASWGTQSSAGGSNTLGPGPELSSAMDPDASRRPESAIGSNIASRSHQTSAVDSNTLGLGPELSSAMDPDASRRPESAIGSNIASRSHQTSAVDSNTLGLGPKLPSAMAPELELSSAMAPIASQHPESAIGSWGHQAPAMAPIALQRRPEYLPMGSIALGAEFPAHMGSIGWRPEFPAMGSIAWEPESPDMSSVAWGAESMGSVASHDFESRFSLPRFPLVRFEEMPTVPVVGMDQILQQLKKSLEDDDTGIIGIFGMAGVGKTALLNKFNNEYLVGAEGINVAIYIEVSRDYDLNKIQKIIGDRLGFSWEKKGPKECAVLLYKVLSKMNFVIILDDLWEPINLRMLGIPVPKQHAKSKIFLSTRIEDVCDRMDVERKIKFDCLPWEHAWELFKEKVGNALARPNPEIQRLAETIATKCGGLPQALITVGRAMVSKRMTREWRHAITVLKIAPWQLLGMENDLLMPLKHSYDNLPNDNLRLCLLYCSLFPENFPIFKEWIIGYCIGEGIVDDLYTEMDDIYNKGHDLLGDLKTASLLESDDEEHMKMHPMVRAMALWIASDYGTKETKWLVRAGIGLKEALGAEKWSDAERISFMRNNIFELYEQPKCPSLKTLMLQSNPALKKICDGFFEYMPTLRVLDLSHTSISELPSGLNALGQLQYLDLFNTNITILPNELGELVNLRFLLLSRTPLETIPNGVLCRLTLLQVLYMDLSYGDWKVGTSGNGIEFQELESLRRLKAFDATIQTVAALERLAQSPRLAGCTRNLLIKAATGLKTLELPLSDLWKNTTELKRVWAMTCADLEEVVINGPDAQLENDPNKLISNIILPGYSTIADEEQSLLPELESIILQKLPKAKIIYKGGCLQQLTVLFIWHCSGLEHLITCAKDEGEEPMIFIEAFPKLKELYLHGLPGFKSFSTERYRLCFPSLRSLKVIECPMLKTLDLSAKDLTEIHGTNEWWKALEWKDDLEVEDRFRSLFQPLR